ncbi:hypothetical protein OAB83_00150 [Candidatus Pelagibacter sp.]|nr:hypothetical protein [Candidatus Pelagibacter sp.]
MKNKKKLITVSKIFSLMILSNCAMSTASIFGPAITVSQTGNVYQAGVSFVSSNVIKKELGKTPIEFIENIISKKPIKNETNHLMTKNKQLKEKKLDLSFSKNEHSYSDFISAVKKNLN